MATGAAELDIESAEADRTPPAEPTSQEKTQKCILSHHSSLCTSALTLLLTATPVVLGTAGVLTSIVMFALIDPKLSDMEMKNKERNAAGVLALSLILCVVACMCKGAISWLKDPVDDRRYRARL